MAVDMVKVAKAVSTVLSIGGTLLSGWAGQKTLEKLVKDQVEKTIAQK